MTFPVCYATMGGEEANGKRTIVFNFSVCIRFNSRDYPVFQVRRSAAMETITVTTINLSAKETMFSETMIHKTIL